MRTDFLVDTSAIVRILRNDDVRMRWRREMKAGLVSYCEAAMLELGRSSRSAADHEEMVEMVNQLFVWEPIPERVFRRAHEIQDKLVDIGHHHGPGAIDLLVAATAEAHSLTVLHYDADFESIARITGQPTRWVAPRGSVN